MLKRTLRRARRALNGDVLDEVVRLRDEIAAMRADQAAIRADQAALRAEQTALRILLEGDLQAIVSQLDQALLTIAFAGARGD
jgi:hypothetical protein